VMKGIKGSRPLLSVLCVASLLLVLLILVSSRMAKIDVLNGIFFAVSAGVVVAFSPIAVPAIFAKEPSSGEVLCVGIWFAWISSAVLRMIFIGIYGFGNTSWSHSNGSAVAIGAGIYAATCHLLAPEAISGWAPHKTWIRIGFWTAVGVLVGLLALVFQQWSVTGDFRFMHI
jgi:hypothetical protein